MIKWTMMVVVACAFAQVGCAADSEPKTSVFAPTTPSAETVAPSPAPASTATTDSAPVPAPVETTSETDSNVPDWMANCSVGTPCVPPDDSDSDSDSSSSDADDSEDACPPFDPICQTEQAMRWAAAH